MTKFLSALALLLTTLFSFAQDQHKSFTVKYISSTEIIPDGILDEAIWESAESAHDFWEHFPVNSVQASQQSDIKMLYDDKNLYIGITVNAAGKNYMVQTLKRDFRAGDSDNITMLFDTFNDGTNAFLFGINPFGVRREGLLSGGGNDIRGFTMSWDTKWKGDSKMYDNYYTSELIIPLTAFKFKEGETKWGFNSYRFDTQSNETSAWMKIPQNQNVFGMTFMGDMIFERPLGKSRSPIAIIPYINAISQKDFENDDKFNNVKIGGDAKIAIGNSMNLDITVNPDFSQVEVDNQVTNLTRFEVSLPEKRQFFIDNSDLFGSFGDVRDANPFFSRRIGIAKDIDDNSIENKIIGGLRLSGKLNKDFRLGLMNILTEADEANEIASNNNTMFAIQQRVFARSNISMFFINRQSIKDYDFLAEEDKYNRVLGMDYNLISKDNKWNGKFFMHKSFEPESDGKDLATGGTIDYNSRHYNIYSKLVYIGEDFRSDLGFVRRTDILKSILGVERVFWPKKGVLNSHSFQFFPIFTWSPSMDLKNTDYTLRSSWEARFNDFSMVSVNMSNRFTFLTDDFEPTGEDDAVALPGNQGYHYNSLEFEYRSDRRKLFAYSLESSIGRFFNGKRYSVEGMLTYRFQPKVFISLLFDYNKLELPQPYSSTDLWLLSPKIDITFNKSLFWSTLVQYSTQQDNLGFNSRLQWRFAPLSDLYLVYNDNYFVNAFAPRSRSINLKFTYWLNI
ncbi:MAG: carbohydrate binding family 9 domain-containing protein [Maribacter sp.]|nr:carbohydrate binding family 9 domain-containing protein [Maribacter sp.]